MSNRATSWAWDVEGLSPTQKLVLVKLADNANDEGYCWPSKKYLIKHTCLSDGAIKGAIRELERKGLVSVIRRKVEERVNLPNHYQLEMPGRAGDDPGVGQEMTQGGSPDAPKPSIEPSIEPIDSAPALAAAPPTASKYRWQGEIIRLTEKDFDRWAMSFRALDLPAELASLDAWLTSDDATATHRKNWFHVIAGALKNRNETARTKADSKLSTNGARKHNIMSTPAGEGVYDYLYR